jgi:hypothetical protein
MKLIITSENSKIGAVFNRDLKFREILTIFSKVEIPNTENNDTFDGEFKESVKQALQKISKKK